MAGMPGRSGGHNRKEGLPRYASGQVKYLSLCACGQQKSKAAQHCHACYTRLRVKPENKEFGTEYRRCECGRRKTRYSLRCIICERNARATSISRNCEWCGTTFRRSRSAKDALRFCSKRCSGARRHALRQPVRQRAFIDREARRRRPCFRCFGIMTLSTRLAEPVICAACHELERREALMRICPACKQPFIRNTPKLNERFCTKRCARIWNLRAHPGLCLLCQRQGFLHGKWCTLCFMAIQKGRYPLLRVLPRAIEEFTEADHAMLAVSRALRQYRQLFDQQNKGDYYAESTTTG